MTAPIKKPAPKKRASLNLRIKPDMRRLIDRGAQARGKSRTDFMLEAACRAAEDALLDQTALRVSPKAYAAFLARLDAKPKPNARLKKTMVARAPWD